jgi:hypothetical protein
MGMMMRGREALTAQLEEYLKGIEADEGEGVTSDLTGKWKKAAKDLMGDILEQVRGYGKDVANEERTPWGPSGGQLGG